MPNLCSDSHTRIQQSSSNRLSTHHPDNDQSNKLRNFAEEEAVVMAHELEHLNLDPCVSNNVLATLKKHLVQGIQNYQTHLRSSCPESTLLNQSRPTSCRARSSSSSSFSPSNPSPSLHPSTNFRSSKSPFQSSMSPQSCSPDSCLPFPIVPSVCSPSPNASRNSSPNANSRCPYEPAPGGLSQSHTPECRLNPSRYTLASQEPSGYPAIKRQMDEDQCPQLSNRYDNEMHSQCKESGVGGGVMSCSLPQQQESESLGLDCSKITKVYLLKECSPSEESPCCQLILQSPPRQSENQGYPPCNRTRQSELSRVNRRFCDEDRDHSSLRRELEPQVPNYESQPQHQASVARSPQPCLSAVLVCSPRKNNSCPCRKQNCSLSKEKQDLLASNPIVRCGFLRLVAMFHGKLTRDLFITEKVIDMIRMIKDTAEVLLSFCFDKKCNLEKEEEQFACRLQSQLQSSLSRLHQLFIETTPEERLAALRGSHNWRVANNFGQPRRRSPPVPALACGAPFPTRRPPLCNPSPPEAVAEASGPRDDCVRCLARSAPLLQRLVPSQPSMRTCQFPTEPPCSLYESPSPRLPTHHLPHVSASNSTSNIVIARAKTGVLEAKPKAVDEKEIFNREKPASIDGAKAVPVGSKSLLDGETQIIDKGEPISFRKRTLATTPSEAKAGPSGPNSLVGTIQIPRGEETLSILSISTPEPKYAPMCLDSWEEDSENELYHEEMASPSKPLVRLWREGSEKSLDSSDPSNAATVPCSGSRDEGSIHSQDPTSGNPISAVVTIPGFLSVNLHRWPSRRSLHIYMPDQETNGCKQNDAPHETDECQAIIQRPNPCVGEAPKCCEMRTTMTTQDAVEKKKGGMNCCGTPRSDSSNTNNTTCQGVPHSNEVETGVNLRLQMYRMVNQLRQEKRLLHGRVMPFRLTKFQRYIRRSHRRCRLEGNNSAVASPTSMPPEFAEDWTEDEETLRSAPPMRWHYDERGAWSAIPISRLERATKSSWCQCPPRQDRMTSGALIAFQWKACGTEWEGRRNG
ncbi:hypothetical protein TcWFU_009040 [Taenia crassiceps]|uniref:Uncharacterized protein n=1 Tax=Taenia crassiceps TaxID=6207 RepID=A0ABR4Q9K9_9CEST